MSVMLLSDRHIATLANYVAAKISGGCLDTVQHTVQHIAQHIAQRLHVINVKEFNRYYGTRKRSRTINLNLAYDWAYDFTANECAALAECWKYNAGQSPEYYVLAAMLDHAFSGVAPSDNVWSI